MVNDRSRALARWNWQRLGDASSLSQRVPLIYLPFGLIGPLLLDPNRIGGTVPEWLTAALIAQLALMTAFFVASLLLRSIHRQSVRPFFVLAALAGAACVRAVALVEVPEILGITDAGELGYRLGAALTTQTGMLIIFALLVSAYDYHRRIASDLREQGRSLDLANRTMQGRLEEMRSLTVIQVQQLIAPLITELDRAAQRSGDHANVKSLVRQIVDEELRPLSHTLVTEEVRIDLPEPTPARSSFSIPLPERLTMRQVLMPLTLGCLTVLLALSPTIRELEGIQALIFPLVSGILVGLIIFAVNAVIGRWRTHLWIAVSAAVVIVGGSFFSAWQLQAWGGIAAAARVGRGRGGDGIACRCTSRSLRCSDRAPDRHRGLVERVPGNTITRCECVAPTGVHDAAAIRARNSWTPAKCMPRRCPSSGCG